MLIFVAAAVLTGTWIWAIKVVGDKVGKTFGGR